MPWMFQIWPLTNVKSIRGRVLTVTLFWDDFFFTGVVLILFGLQNVIISKTLHTAGSIFILFGIFSTILMFYILINVGKRMTEISMVLTRESPGFSECFFSDTDEISKMGRHVIDLLHQKDLLEISERRADASAKSMESLITHASVPICEITRDGRMLNMNIMASQLFGELGHWDKNLSIPQTYHRGISAGCTISFSFSAKRRC